MMDSQSACAKFIEQENLLQVQRQDIDHALNEGTDILSALRRKLTGNDSAGCARYGNGPFLAVKI